jgi:hypothetical protein
METHDDPKSSAGANAESDVLAFFYADAVGALARLRDDAEDLVGFATRLRRLVDETGIPATTVHRAEFHRACRAASRVSALTFRLIETLDLD